jgi:hypothetical protein
MPTHSAASIIADAYNRLIDQPGGLAAVAWTVAEQAIWDVVTARCQKDMGGIETVFTDCGLDVSSLVRSLELLDEPELAAAWASACAKLTERGYLVAGTWSGAEGQPHQDVFGILDDALGDRMWDLDEKLVKLFVGRRS